MARGGGRGEGRGGFDPNMTPEERQRRREERMKSMSPEERAAFEARMREGGGGRGGFGGRNGGGPGEASGAGATGRQNARGNAPAAVPRVANEATTIDSLFAPIQIVERPGMGWLHQNNQLKPLRLRLGVSDGTFTEIVNGSEIPDNTEVVVGMTTGLEARTPAPGGNQQNNPLLGPQRGQPGRGGGGGGGGRGRG